MQHVKMRCCCNVAPQAVNPIGSKRKDHKYGVLLGRIINFPKHLRDAFDSLLLLGLYNVKHAKRAGGVCRMLAGVHQETGEKYDEFSFARELDQLRVGHPIEIPDDVNGGTMTVLLEVHFIGLCADLLGAAGCGPWTECFRAQHPCLDCWWHSSCFCAYLPANSSEARRKGAHHADCKRLAPRTDEETLRIISTIKDTQFSSKAARATAMRQGGVYKLHSALQYIAGARLSEDARKDIMHLLLRGITAHELLWIIDAFVKVRCNVRCNTRCNSSNNTCCLKQDGEFTWDELNDMRKKLTLLKGHKIPELYAPKSDGKAMSSKSICLNGSGVLHTAVNR